MKNGLRRVLKPVQMESHHARESLMTHDLSGKIMLYFSASNGSLPVIGSGAAIQPRI